MRMSNSTALDVMRIALQQYGYTESPPNSNRTKYGRDFGWNGTFWCAIFSWWCGEKAKGDNPIAKSASAAYIEDLTVSQKGGKYILRQTSSNTKKKEAKSKYRFGDEISFNFNGGSNRDHTGLIIGVRGNTIYCIEGNTSFSDKGSQSNGGCVASRARNYTTGVCVVRPKYKAHKWHVPKEAYHGKVPILPSDGCLEYKDRGSAVKVLQRALAWANGYDLKADGEFGSHTYAEVVIFQVSQGLIPDGEFGSQSLKAMKKLIAKHKNDSKPSTTKPTTEEPKKEEEEVAKKNNMKKLKKIADMARRCAWAYGTPKKKYRYPSGKRKKAYVLALKKAYGDRKGWGKQTKAGASCDVFVGTCVRASGVDPHFPRGLDEQIPYLEKSKRWRRGSRKLKNMKPGYIIVQQYKTGGKHIMIYLGNGYVANAHYVKKTYPIIEKYSKIVKPKSKCKIYRVYRPV